MKKGFQQKLADLSYPLRSLRYGLLDFDEFVVTSANRDTKTQNPMRFRRTFMQPWNNRTKVSKNDWLERRQLIYDSSRECYVKRTNDDEGYEGAGGLIRDSNGKWLVGFAAHLGICTNMAAELHALRLGAGRIRIKAVKGVIHYHTFQIRA